LIPEDIIQSLPPGSNTSNRGLHSYSLRDITCKRATEWGSWYCEVSCSPADLKWRWRVKESEGHNVSLLWPYTLPIHWEVRAVSEIQDTGSCHCRLELPTQLEEVQPSDHLIQLPAERNLSVCLIDHFDPHILLYI
jgi:hypothetical protein